MWLICFSKCLSFLFQYLFVLSLVKFCFFFFWSVSVLCILSFSVSIFLGSIEFSVLLASSYFSVSDSLEQSEFSVSRSSAAQLSVFCRLVVAVCSVGLHFLFAVCSAGLHFLINQFSSSATAGEQQELRRTTVGEHFFSTFAVFSFLAHMFLLWSRILLVIFFHVRFLCGLSLHVRRWPIWLDLVVDCCNFIHFLLFSFSIKFGCNYFPLFTRFWSSFRNLHVM